MELKDLLLAANDGYLYYFFRDINVTYDLHIEDKGITVFNGDSSLINLKEPAKVSVNKKKKLYIE